MKQCRTCKIWKPLNQFGPKKEAADKHEYRCRVCERKRRKEWASRPETKEMRRKYAKNRYRNIPHAHLNSRRCLLRSDYGLTLEEYNRMAAEQDEVCAICGKPETIKNRFTKRYLSVDHNHQTGKIRGLLCSKCNSVIGYAKDSITTLKNTIKYLEKYDD